MGLRTLSGAVVFAAGCGLLVDDFSPASVIDASDASSLDAPAVDRFVDAPARPFIPSNHVDTLPNNATGVVDLGPDCGYTVWVADTDTGAISGGDRFEGPLAPVRAPGRGSFPGPCGTTISFGTLSQETGASGLGVFGVEALRVRSGSSLLGIGSQAMVWVSRADVDIAGTVWVSAKNDPGPGGFAGGLTPDASANGIPGAPDQGGGHGGVGVGEPDAHGGGGGGGYGTPGGSGGPGWIGDGGMEAASGAGGALRGNPTLVPLVGGSGGASGAHDHGAFGGHGGGAVQITAAGRIRIEPTGTVVAHGSGGGSGLPATGGSGGGGGSGGAILLEASRIEVRGCVAALGGAGGGGGGAGFPPGASPIQCAPAAGTPTTGNSGGGGGSGLHALPLSATFGVNNGGGGGGGDGRIRFNANDAQIELAGTVLPAPSTATR